MPSRLGHRLYKKIDRLKIFFVVYSIIKLKDEVGMAGSKST